MLPGGHGHVAAPCCRVALALVAPKVLLLVPAGDRLAVKIMTYKLTKGS